MFGAGAGLTPGLDLGAVGNHPPQSGDILVIDAIDLVDAELAGFAALEEAATTAPAEAPRAPSACSIASSSVAETIATGPIAEWSVAERPIAKGPVASRPVATRPVAERTIAGRPVAETAATGPISQVTLTLRAVTLVFHACSLLIFEGLSAGPLEGHVVDIGVAVEIAGRARRGPAAAIGLRA